MNPALEAAIASGDYEALPESIKAVYSQREYAWLSDAQKAGLTRTELEPEWSEP